MQFTTSVDEQIFDLQAEITYLECALETHKKQRALRFGGQPFDITMMLDPEKEQTFMSQLRRAKRKLNQITKDTSGWKLGSVKGCAR